MKFKNMLELFSKKSEDLGAKGSFAIAQDDGTHPSHLSQTILNRLFGRVLEREGEFNVLFKGRLGWVSCAKHTVKYLLTYSPIHLFTFKKCAFTLAEVLITLGIIGLVAAMTLPSIITDYQKKVTIKKLRTTYNILNNAIEMAKTEYGTDVNSWDMPDTNDIKILSDYFAEHYMLPYLKVVKDCKNSRNCAFYAGTNTREFVLSNGAIIVVSVTGVGKNVQNVKTRIFIYINGKVNNINYARDRFLVELGGGDGKLDLDNNKFLPYGYGTSANCNVHKNVDSSACNKTANKSHCFALIMCEGWKIPDDYPW